MLQGVSNHYNTSSASDSRLVSRLSSMTPRNKTIVGSALVLSFFSASNIVMSQSKHNSTMSNQGTSVEAPRVVPAISGLQETTEEQGESNVETKLEINTSSSIGGQPSSPSLDLKVNGQDINVPTNGEVNETVTNTDGSTINLHVHNSSTSTTEEDNETEVKIKSKTESEVRIRSSD